MSSDGQIGGRERRFRHWVVRLKGRPNVNFNGVCPRLRLIGADETLKAAENADRGACPPRRASG